MDQPPPVAPDTRRLIRAVLDLSTARTVEQIRAIVRTAAREMVQADGATFVLRDGDFCHYVDEDAIGPLWKGQRFPLSACISGWSMRHRQAAAIPDIFVDPRIPVDAYRSTFVKSLVMVPIREAEPIGAIGTYWATPRAAPERAIELLQALANTTAVAMENVLLYQELEERVRRRTQELEAVNEELDAFSYSVSHDLRAPLRHVSGFASRLHKVADLDPESRRFADIIVSSAASMSQLIDDLLTFARLGRGELSTAPVDLGAVACEAQREAMRDARDRDIEWSIADVAAIVPADAALIRQVMLNLLSNAVRYTRGRSPARIDVGFTVTGEQVEVRVRDNGVGFDPGQAARLFGVFQRLHSSTEFDGTGIGLANVRRIISRHGGRTWATGAPGEGATFGFTLPIQRQRGVEPAAHALRDMQPA